jgi:hypothetical protein
MRKNLFMIILITLLVLTPSARGTSQIEYGTLAELDHKSKVFVYAANLDMRQDIIKELDKKKGEKFQVVGKPEEAEIFIIYGSQVFDTGVVSMSTIIGGVGVGSASRTTSSVGEYYVLVPGDRLADGGIRPRVLWGKQGVVGPTLKDKLKGRSSAAQITRMFLKELEEIHKSK